MDKVLNDYKNKNAVALKVASAYFRTLWFDNPDEEEVKNIFREGMGQLFDNIIFL